MLKTAVSAPSGSSTKALDHSDQPSTLSNAHDTTGGAANQPWPSDGFAQICRRTPRQGPAVWLASGTGEPPAATAAPKTKHGTPLEPGDIICFPDGSKSALGAIIPGDYSHVAMYIGNGQMVEATVPLEKIGPDPSTWGELAGEVRIIDAPSDYSNLTVLRVKGLDANARQKAVDFAKSKEGLPYDYQWFLWLAGGKEVDGPSYYCSELVWAAYMAQNVDLDAKTWSFKCGPNVSPQEIVDDPDTKEI